MTIEEFIEKCRKHPIPNSAMPRLRLQARELAEGASLKLWSIELEVNSPDWKNKIYPFLIKRYEEFDFNQEFPLLRANGYISSLDLGSRRHLITQKSFDLLKEIEESVVFISYKRSESSAFALLVRNTLKQHGVEPFVDMQLQAGDDWHAELEENIKNSDYFIVLLGNETLNSEVTVKEIQWALEGNVRLIPIWHNGFAFRAEDWANLPDDVSHALASMHTIRVLEENPLTYDTALRELLNRFGISI